MEISDRLHASLSYTRKPDPDRIQNQIADFLAAHGFHEVMNNSLTRSAWYEGSADFPPGRLVKMLNPISRDLDVLRQTLFFGILESIVFNMNRKEPDLKLFEFGKVYSLAGKPSTGDPVGGYHEEMHFAMAVTGRRDPESWNSADQPSGFYDLKGFLGGVFEKLGIDTGLWQPVSFRSDIIGNGLEYSAHGETLAFLGVVNNSVLEKFDCRQPVFYAELNWERLLAKVPVKTDLYREIPRFPEVRRDLALIVDKEITFVQIEQVVNSAEKKLLRRVGLFDVYEGDKIPQGKKSYAISLYLQDETKTLTDKEIEKAMERIIRALTGTLNAQLRS